MSKLIALDPGHGGTDPGATGNGLREKNVVFGVRIDGQTIVADGMAQRIGNYLRRLGFRTVLTRDSDERVAFVRRAAKAVGAEAYISLHCNAAANPTARGCEVWYSHLDSSSASSDLARAILFAILSASDQVKSRGVKSSASNIRVHNVLRRAGMAMPAVLIEFGFITNPQDARLLADRKWRDTIAQAVAQAVQEFFLRDS